MLLIMSIGLENIEKINPDWVRGISVEDTLIFLSFCVLIFGIPYLYIRFIERRLVLFVRNRMIPFFKFRI